MTIAIGEHMRPAAETLRLRASVPFRLLAQTHGLAATDSLVELLLDLSGGPVPERVKRDRSRLVDAMLDAHFPFTARPVAIAGEADLVCSFSHFLADLGAVVDVATVATDGPASRAIPAKRRLVGDLDDFERAAADCDLLVANAHAAELAKRLEKPLYRIGFPQFDRFGGWARVAVGYHGARQTLFDLANLLIDSQHHPHPPTDRTGAAACGEVAHA
jgi:nitrogenase molybdenum-iron protein NifN